MIRDRNIATDARISPTKIRGAHGNMGIQDEYFVAKSTYTQYQEIREVVSDSRLFNNITDAVAAAGKYDVIWVYPGTITEAAKITVGSGFQGGKIIGVGNGIHKAAAGAGIQTYDQSFRAMDVDTTGVEIANITFVAGNGQGGLYLGVAANGSGWIHGNFFYDVYQNAEYSLDIGNTSDSINTVVEDNWFFKGKVCCRQYGSRSVVQRNYFEVLHPNTCLQFVPDGAARNGGSILSNRFLAIGTASEQKGIAFTGTPTAGNVSIDDNRFFNFASAAYAIGKETTNLIIYAGLNYWGTTAIPLA